MGNRRNALHVLVVACTVSIEPSERCEDLGRRSEQTRAVVSYPETNTVRVRYKGCTELEQPSYPVRSSVHEN
jgi:hypothetical protein